MITENVSARKRFHACTNKFFKRILGRLFKNIPCNMLMLTVVVDVGVVDSLVVVDEEDSVEVVDVGVVDSLVVVDEEDSVDVEVDVLLSVDVVDVGVVDSLVVVDEEDSVEVVDVGVVDSLVVVDEEDSVEVVDVGVVDSLVVVDVICKTILLLRQPEELVRC